MRRIAFFIPHEGCPRHCVFCNQNSISGVSKVPSLSEIENTLTTARENLGIATKDTQIAFFGGSFTAINPKLRKSLLETATKYCGEGGFSGIRFSTRPDCITPEILEELSHYAVSHIELGVQSMDDRVLTMNRRGHTYHDTIRASKLIKQAGYPQTLQMMIGLYGDTWDTSINTAYDIADLEPEEVRIYPTLVLKNTYLSKLYETGQYVPLELTNTIKIGAELLDIFAARNIKVIRLGLHDEDGFKNEVIAGPHHPALRELSEGYRRYNKALDIIEKENIYAKNPTIVVSPRDISKIKGHGGWVLSLFENKGYRIKIEISKDIESGDIKVKQ